MNPSSSSFLCVAVVQARTADRDGLRKWQSRVPLLWDFVIGVGNDEVAALATSDIDEKLLFACQTELDKPVSHVQYMIFIPDVL